MYNSLDTSCGEIHNIGWDKYVPKFIDFHNKAPNISNLPHFRHIKSLSLKSSHFDSSRNHDRSYDNKGLTHFPKEILLIKSTLSVLDLSHNKFEYFPLEVLQIETLIELKMDYNKIKSLPSEIEQLSRLEILSLGHNAIQFLPPSVFRLVELRELNLESNSLDHISDDLGQLKHLKILNLMHNKFDSLPTSFGKLVELKEFQLEWFRYTDPKLVVHQRGSSGECNIRKLREKCNNLSQETKNLPLNVFLNFFSFSRINFATRDSQGRSILHEACFNEDISIIKYVIYHAPELVDCCDKYQMSPLCVSLLEEKHRSVRYLLKYGANVTHGGGVYGSPLHIATKVLNVAAVQKILECNGNPNKPDGKGNTPLHHALSLMNENYEDAKRIAQLLLDYKTNPNIKNRENWTPLHTIARRRDDKALSWILAYNFELEEIHGGEEIFNLNKGGGTFNWTPIHIAAYIGAPELIIKLGEAGVNIFKKSVNGYTPKRVVNRPSLTLKFVEKYEKRWIHKEILNKPQDHPENLAFANVTKHNNNREIKFASKNKFNGISLLPGDCQKERVKHRVRMISPPLGSGSLFKRNDTDAYFGLDSSYCADLETDELSGNENFIDFNSELNECVNIEVDSYSREMPQSQNKKEIATAMKTRESQEYFISDNQPKTNSLDILDIDNEIYEMRLKQMSKFDQNFCREELNFFKDNLVSNKISASDKMRIFIALRTLHKFIIKHIYKVFRITVPNDLLSYCVFQKKGNLTAYLSQFNQIKTFFESVPQFLINCFMSFGNQNHENARIKICILRMLVDLKYYSAQEFLKNLMNNTVESILVRLEAKGCYNELTSSLNYDSKKNT